MHYPPSAFITNEHVPKEIARFPHVDAGDDEFLDAEGQCQVEFFDDVVGACEGGVRCGGCGGLGRRRRG